MKSRNQKQKKKQNENLIKINSNHEIIKMDNDVVDQQHKIKQKSDHLAQVDELQSLLHLSKHLNKINSQLITTIY
jgi:hypothetical protein